jgi:hypothetical protein
MKQKKAEDAPKTSKHSAELDKLPSEADFIFNQKGIHSAEEESPYLNKKDRVLWLWLTIGAVVFLILLQVMATCVLDDERVDDLDLMRSPMIPERADKNKPSEWERVQSIWASQMGKILERPQKEAVTEWETPLLAWYQSKHSGWYEAAEDMLVMQSYQKTELQNQVNWAILGRGEKLKRSIDQIELLISVRVEFLKREQDFFAVLAAYEQWMEWIQWMLRTPHESSSLMLLDGMHQRCCESFAHWFFAEERGEPLLQRSILGWQKSTEMHFDLMHWYQQAYVEEKNKLRIGLQNIQFNRPLQKMHWRLRFKENRTLNQMAAMIRKQIQNEKQMPFMRLKIDDWVAGTAYNPEGEKYIEQHLKKYQAWESISYLIKTRQELIELALKLTQVKINSGKPPENIESLKSLGWGTVWIDAFTGGNYEYSAAEKKVYSLGINKIKDNTQKNDSWFTNEEMSVWMSF